MAYSLTPCTSIEREESAKLNDMAERGRRLAAFKAATEGRVWQRQRTGVEILVTPGEAVPSEELETPGTLPPTEQ